MKNIWTIFKTDLRNLGKNAISWVVVVGLAVIPSLYAWFCIYAFWDPYNNTENLKVAVASVDEGYESSLVPVNINIGKEVLEQLRENHQMKWIFVNRDEAIRGVKSGAYYAALVIPEDFSRNLLSILSEDVKKAEIVYYYNEKENAIAAKVTNQGASAVEKTIDEAFAKTASDLTLSSLDTISRVMGSEDAESLVENLNTKLNNMTTELDSAAETMDRLCQMNTTLNQLLKSTDDLLTGIGENTSSAVEDIRSMNDSFSSTEEDLNALSEKIDTVFQNTDQAYRTVRDRTTQYLTDVNEDAGEVSTSLDTFASQIQTIIDRYTDLQDNVQNLSDSLPEQMEITRTLFNDLSTALDRSIRQQTQIHDSLTEASEEILSVSTDALQYQQELSDYIDQNSQSMKDLQTRFQDEVRPEMQTLADAFTQTRQAAETVTDGLHGTAEDIRNLSGSASGQVDQINQNLTATRDLLQHAADKTRQILDQLNQEDGSSAQDILSRLMNNNASTVSSYFSSVVRLDTHIIYPVANFGAAMAPFYTCLAIWVGGTVLVAMLKTTVSRKTLDTLHNAKNWQIYLGRSCVFILIGLCQSLLISTGDLFFLRVQCVHPFLFILTCLYISFVFVTLVYTLTVSFGNIGKAIAVILMVMQVAGSGGTLPIEMTPPFFHIFYPLLPVTHAMAALRECITGLYGNDYLIDLGILSIYIGISLLLGLVLRNPMINMNRKFVEKVESTKVM